MKTKTKTTATKEEAKPALVPKLRFPGFSDSWAHEPLSKVLKEHKLKNTEGRDVFSVSMEYGIVNQIELLGRSYAAADPSHYTIGRRYDVVYTKSPLKAFPFGIVKQCKFDGEVALSPLYGVFTPPNPHVGLIIEAYFESPNRSKDFLSPLCQKGAKNTLQITNTTFLSGRLPLPTQPAEQQKIAECLSSVDELMAAQARKVDALKTHKKGLMQQLFPREGETQPRLRFPEFQNAGEWEEWRFDKVFDRLKTKNTTNEQNVLTISAQEGLVSQLDYFNKSVSSKDISGYQLLIRGDFAYNKSYSQGYPWGAIKPLKRYDAGVVSPLYICFRLRENITYSGSFFEQYFDAGCLDSELEKIAQEGARNHGMLNIGILDFFDRNRLWIPLLKEQQRIATCLGSLDALIAAETQKLEALKTHKKGLMQQLFPSPEEVAV